MRLQGRLSARRVAWAAASVLAAVAVLAGRAGADYDVYAPVPDVEPNLPNASVDWLASAAEVLGAAGWGPDVPAQDSAEAIYQQLVGQFGTQVQATASVSRAMSWWLVNYGTNPDQPAWYQPARVYSDLTAWRAGGRFLDANDYEFLLDELARGQYASVKWETANGPITMTLAGGNYISGDANRNLSVWRNSRLVGTGDDVYANGFISLFDPNLNEWNLTDFPHGGDMAGAAYALLGPGLRTPDSPARNYDAAWHLGHDPNYPEQWDPAWRLAGQKAALVGQPAWQSDTLLKVPNRADANLPMDFYLLVDYADRSIDPADANTVPDIQLLDDLSQLVSQREFTVSPDGGQVLYHWTLTEQPPFEFVQFPDDTYRYLDDPVIGFDIASEFVPAPTVAGLLLAGGAALALRRRRRA